MSELTRRVAATVGRHFVSLSCVEQVSNVEPKALVFSGFVIDIYGEWYYVTAGHIIRSVRRAMAAGATFDRWRLDDSTAGQFKGIAIPYDFRPDNWMVIEDAQIGLDYAVSHLAPYYRTHLEKGNVVGIANASWGDYTYQHDHWALVGIPSESIKWDRKTILAGRFVITPLVPSDRPPDAARRADNQFYARFREDPPPVVRDPDGLSGGPIFALKKDGDEWHYWVIGLQSSWYPDSRILAACPFSSFGMALEELLAPVAEMRSNAKQGDSRNAS